MVSDGSKVRIVVVERIRTDSIPWEIPSVVDEREETWNGGVSEMWLHPCNPLSHYSQKHLSMKEVLDKYSDFVLREAE